MAESFSREKSRQAPQKEGGKILCGPGWCVYKSDVQNKWDYNTNTRALSVSYVFTVVPTTVGVGNERRTKNGSW